MPSRKKAAASPGPTVPTPLAQEIVLVGGMPAGGKTTITAAYLQRGYQRLNRDTVGGKVDELLPRLEQVLTAGRSAVLDNLYATRASRAAVLALAKKRQVPIRFVLLDTSLEDAQFNACLRMMERCGRVLHPEHHKDPAFKDDPPCSPSRCSTSTARNSRSRRLPRAWLQLRRCPSCGAIRRSEPTRRSSSTSTALCGPMRTRRNIPSNPLKCARSRSRRGRCGNTSRKAICCSGRRIIPNDVESLLFEAGGPAEPDDRLDEVRMFGQVRQPGPDDAA